MGEGRTGSLEVDEGDGEDGVHGRGEGVDGGLPVCFQSHERDAELFNPVFGSWRAGKKNHPFAQFLCKKACRRKEPFGIFVALGADDYELVFFQGG